MLMSTNGGTMRKLIILFLCLSFCTVLLADDRVVTQIRYRKAIWTCKCGQVDYTDLNMSGMNTYEHYCSKCGKWSNSFTNYSGSTTYTKDRYDTLGKTILVEKTDEEGKPVLDKDGKPVMINTALSQDDVNDRKQELAEKWKYNHDNPPAYIEPSQAEWKQLYADRKAEADEYEDKIKYTKEELEAKKAELEEKLANVTDEIDKEISK